MERAESGTEPRVRLSKERVLRAAVALADRRGIESLTMRKLADELGAGAMSLYYHLPNKDALLDGMVDIVFSEIELPPGGADWKTAMRERAISAREALSRHRWAIGLMETRTSPGPANLRHHDAVLACLRKARFSVEMAVHAYSALDAYIYGFALQEKSMPFETPEESAEVAEMIVQQMPADEYPYLREVAIKLGESGYSYADEFEFGLDALLDGLERLLTSD